MPVWAQMSAPTGPGGGVRHQQVNRHIVHMRQHHQAALLGQLHPALGYRAVGVGTVAGEIRQAAVRARCGAVPSSASTMSFPWIRRVTRQGRGLGWETTSGVGFGLFTRC